MTKPFPAAPTLTLLLLAACGTATESPSLAPRAVEREFTGAPPPTGPCAADADGCYRPDETEAAPALPADDAALRARVTELSAAADKGQTEFVDRLPAANAAAARAGAQGSDAWVAAQLELSRLEAARTGTLDALSALDVLVLERARQPTSAADLDALAAATERVRGLADAQGAEVQRLGAALSRP